MTLNPRRAPLLVLAILVSLTAWGTARAAVTIEMVSLGIGGAPAETFCTETSLSGDGRFVAYNSRAANLVANDTNGFSDIFVSDRQNGTVERVSVSETEAQSDGASRLPTISADGRFVAFISGASNLVPGDTNGIEDIFVRDRQLGTTQRVSLRSDGAQVPPDAGAPVSAAISGNGRVVAMQHTADLIGPQFGMKTGGGTYVRDLDANVTERVAFKPNGSDAVRGNNCAINHDGRFVAFDSFEIGLVPEDATADLDLFVRDRQTNTTEWLSPAIDSTPEPGNSMFPRISPDGRFVSFYSDCPDLVVGDTNEVGDIFLRDRQTDQTERISVGPGGAQANALSMDHSTPSADGRFVIFSSLAGNLVDGDTNQNIDVFVRDRQAGTNERISVTAAGAQGFAISFEADLSDEAGVGAFVSAAELVPGANNFGQVYAVELSGVNGNQPPEADAPSDRIVKTKAAKAKVKLDGSGSSDPDGDKLTFRWLEGKTQIATGVKPSVKLKKGVHTITLEVRDPAGLTDTDEVVITVKRKRR